MSPGFSFIVFLIASVLHLTRGDGDGHHEHVIIHVPYKIHTIHHTILKHIHHGDSGGEDKYEVLGYTVGKPLDYGHHLGSGGGGGGGDHLLHQHHQYQELEGHDFSGSNELGHGHDWTPSFGHHNFAGGGGDDDYTAESHYAPLRRSYFNHGGFHRYA